MKQSLARKLSGPVETLLLAAFLTSLAALFASNHWLWRWDNLLYDAQLSSWERPANKAIVLITIDDASLSALGHWPWPRSIHARLIKRLSAEKPRAIGMDIIFSEADRSHPEQDRALAMAMANSGKVVLPVYMTQKSQYAWPREALPMPILAEQAAALGHVHVNLGDDGIARQVYLYEGIGNTLWPHFSLAMLNLSRKPFGKNKLLHKTDQPKLPASVMQWTRRQLILIPYAGPPGHFQRISYKQVLDGQYPHGFFKDKLVLIGATAEGLGDVLPTPFSGHSRAMSGVEINANILDALLNHIRLTKVNRSVAVSLSVFLTLLPLVIFQFLKPRSALVALLLILVATTTLSGILLWLFHLWYSPAVALLFQLISYPLWSWRRLEHAVAHLNHELNNLNQQRKKLSIHRHSDIHQSIAFISTLIAINGWILLDENNHTVDKNGQQPLRPDNIKNKNNWFYTANTAWVNLPCKHAPCRLGIAFNTDTVISDDDKRLLNQLLWNLQENEIDRYIPGDFIDAKIQQIQLAETNLQKLRRFIDDGLSNMADGVIVCDACGEILLSNARASWYLLGDDHALLHKLSLTALLADIHLPGNASWQPLLAKTLLRQQRVITQAIHKSGRHLMVQISPLDFIEHDVGGLVINLSDIQLLKASEKKRDELLNFLSHDLRSPLSATLAELELGKQEKDSLKLHQTMDKISQLTHKTLHLAEQFLQLSRAKSSQDLPMYDVDFNTVALNAIEQLWMLAREKNIIIEKHFGEDELWIKAEPDLLERALVNLISNAIKYSEKDTTIEVDIITDNKNIHCCISDEGFGIPADELPDMFESFKRVHREGEKNRLGIGLGLAFVDAVAKRHQGHIEVESSVGQGSRFCLIIPYG